MSINKLGKVVSNSSPIIGLSKLGLINLLWEIFSEVIVTEAVYDEVVIKGENSVGHKELKQAVDNCQLQKLYLLI